MDFNEAAKRVHLNRSVAFFGAAFSKDATNLNGDGMMAAGGLAKAISDMLGEAEPLPLELASQEYVRQNVQPDIRELVVNSYSALKISDYQRHLSSLPWQRMYTTNYDNILEAGRRESGIAALSATVLESPSDFSGRAAIIHLHGFVERITKDEWDNTYVLTNEQYASDLLRESGWLETFRNDVNYADSIFFFGYSIQDLDIARLMYENPALAEKTFIVAGATPSRATEIRTQGYGNLVRATVSDAAASFPAAGAPDASQPSPYLANLQPIAMSPADHRPGRDVVLNYLIKGDFDPSFASRDLTNGTSEYFVSRDAINTRADSLGARPERILIHSSLGGGKSSALIELSHYLLTAGWTALLFNGEKEGLEYDIDYLASLGSATQARTAILIENAFAYTREIKHLIERFPLISFFLTSRSAALQTRIGEISQAFGDEFELIDLNEITEDEAADLNNILYDNGLWGDRQGASEKTRMDYILRVARADLPTLLVDICRSSDIFARVRDELREIEKNSKDLRKSLIITLCLTVAGARLNLNQICDVVQTDLFKMGKIQNDAALNEFIDFDRGRVSARSATFSRAVLRDIIADSLIIDAIPSVISRLDRLSDTSEIYNEALKGMMRFGFIEAILGDAGKEEKLVSFYEAIRATGVGINNPQFWLQYAIACMSFGDYNNADLHFSAAFGLAAKRGGYDPYQIENQYARFLLESRTQTSKWTDFFDAFHKAHEIVARQMTSFKEGFYPYRVARSYLPFVEAHAKAFTRDQKGRIIGWCDQLLKLADNAPKSIKRTRYWREADIALRSTKDYLLD